tara:strand:- start:794 stop:973 length:180 start_codon:yes stop_codon:yes gene_type:complete
VLLKGKKKLIKISKFPKINNPTRGAINSDLVYKIFLEEGSFEYLNIFDTKNFPRRYKYK